MRVVASTLLLLLPLSAPTLAGEASGRIGEFIGDGQFTTQVFELATKSGLKGASKEQPWSGSYWPLHSGSIANPYNENNGAWINNTFRKLKSVKANAKHFEKRLVEIRQKWKELPPEMIDEMAPSEKYDLFLGDYDFTLTRSIWISLFEQYDRIGKLALWEGSCHGWATSSSYVGRPKNLIRVMSLDGRYLIPFYPDDIKALATLLWANSLIQDHTIVLGQRCNSRNPEFDESNGKVLSETCQGVNPADMHVSLLELMGARKQTYIVNRENNTQVWNQPIVSYEMKYFNLSNGKEGNLQDVILARQQYADPFRAYRSGRATSVVGVDLVLKYASERNPTHRKTDKPENDKIKKLHFRYDLELDGDNKIIGGEWISSDDSPQDEDDTGVQPPKYPGFIWKFQTAQPVAFSIGDADIQGDDVTKIDVKTVLSASQKASKFKYNVYHPKPRTEKRPQPLAKIVNMLVKQSHEASTPAE